MDDGFWQCSIATVAVSYQKLLVLDVRQVPRQVYLYKLGNYRTLHDGQGELAAGLQAP